jgi:hypothetical protein
VVLIQPMMVVALPISLVVGWMIGGPRPQRGDYLACLGIIGGLAAFFALIGDPGQGSPLSASAAAITIAVAFVAGLGLCLSVVRCSAPVRAGVYGGVAGAWFGLVGVLLNAVATTFRDRGFDTFTHPDGLVPLAGILVIGGVGITLTQISFQVGALGASFPANKAADPVVAVVLGAVLLHEDVPVGGLFLPAYAICLLAIVAGTVRLANPPAPAPAGAGPSPGAAPSAPSPATSASATVPPRVSPD